MSFNGLIAHFFSVLNNIPSHISKFWHLSKAAITFCVHRFQLLCKYQGSWFLDHMVGVCLLSWEMAKLSSKVSIPFCVPTSNEWQFLFLHILVSVCCCQFLVLLILMDMWWYLTVRFSFHWPGEMEHLSICLFAICISSLIGCLLKSLVYF